MNRLNRYVENLKIPKWYPYIEFTINELNKFAERLPDGYYALGRWYMKGPMTMDILTRKKNRMYDDWARLELEEYRDMSFEDKLEWMGRFHGLLGVAYFNAALRIYFTRDKRIEIAYDRAEWIRLCREFIRMIAKYDQNWLSEIKRRCVFYENSETLNGHRCCVLRQ